MCQWINNSMHEKYMWLCLSLSRKIAFFGGTLYTRVDRYRAAVCEKMEMKNMKAVSSWERSNVEMIVAVRVARTTMPRWMKSVK